MQNQPIQSPETKTEEIAVPKTATGKKSKKGLIAAIAVLIALVAGGSATAIVLISKQNAPENIVLDAVTKTIKEESQIFSGSVSANSDTTGSIEIGLDGKSHGLNSDASITASMSSNSIGNYTFGLHEISQDDGTLYLGTTGLADVVSSLLSSFSVLLSTSSSDFTDSVEALAEEIDANWWKFSTDDAVATSLVSEEAVDCALGATKDLVSSAGLEKIADIYKGNQFMNAARSDFKPDSFTDNSFEITLDREKLVGFINQFATSDNVQKISQCFATADEVTIPTITSDQLPDLSDYKFYLDIDGSHNLIGLYAELTAKEVPVVADFRFGHGNVNIEAPVSSRPVTDLFEDIEQISGAATSLFASSSL